MKNKDTLLIISSAALAMLLVVSGFGAFQSKSHNETFDFTYSIPRLKRFVPSFLLRDRVVRHTGLEKKDLIAARPKPVDKTNNKPQGNGQPVAKKDSKNKTATKKNSAEKSKKFAVSITGDNKKESFTNSKDLRNDSGPNGSGGSYNPTIAKKDFGTLAQQILASPTKELMNEWVRLFLSGEIRKDEFYNLIADLLESGNLRGQNVALYGLASTPSFESFSQLAAASELLEATEKEQAIRYLSAYTHSDYLKILELALASKNTIVVEKASIYVALLAERMKSTFLSRFPSAADNLRVQRGEPSVIPPDTFVKTLELLRTITKGTDSRLTSIANDSIRKISAILEG